MCLAVPARLIECKGASALADLHGNHIPISTLLIPDCQVGDWVLLHAGFAIQKLDEDEARQTWALINDLQKNAGNEA
jgi:hydrogenase expression/formation protein HypC